MRHHDEMRPLTYDTLFSDPLIRLMMDADGVTRDELAAVMQAARDAVAARNRLGVRGVTRVPGATSVPA